jgi:hypothetical protein
MATSVEVCHHLLDIEGHPSMLGSDTRRVGLDHQPAGRTGLPRDADAPRIQGTDTPDGSVGGIVGVAPDDR